ncbi:MAG: ribonuclease, partial [Candidatus Cloacimonetes bacterium]|nr:ribonuclease [Candidatus Cloacimonadota bacterium]
MKKRMLIMGGILLLVSLVFGQYVVDFEGEGETKSAYASGNVTLSGIKWDLTEVLIGPVGSTDADWYNGTRAARLRGYGASAMTMVEDKSNGIGTISFQYRRYGTEGQVDWKVEYSTDNGFNWIQVGEVFTAPASDVVQTFSETINEAGNARIRIKRHTESGTTNKRLNIDDITLTDYTPSVPLLSFNPGSLSGFGYEQGSGPSIAQSYTVTGTDLSPLSGNITILSSSAYEYSTTGSSFSSTLQLPYTGGQLSKTVYIRLKAGLTVGEYNQNITHQGGGATAQFRADGNVISYITSFDGSFTEDFSGFVSAETLPPGWELSDTYAYGGDFGAGSAGGLRGNGVFGMQLTSSAPNDNLTASLTLWNTTGDTITSLHISYDGKVERNNQSGTPKWVVKLDGTVIPELEYDTAENINKNLTATLGALSIAPGAIFTLSWFTTSAGTSGTRKQIGFTNLDIHTEISDEPQIHTNASLAPFSTTMGQPSASQNYQLSGHNLNANIQVTAPSGFQLSTDDTTFYPILTLSPTFSGDIWVRMTGENGGTYGGNIVHTSTGATAQNVEVYGSVSSGGGGGYASDLFFSEYIEGSSNNKALEIFNGTGQEVDLSDYKVILFTNGSPTPSQTLALSGILAHQDVFVLAHGSSNQDILAVADITHNSVCNFNGDDALALQKISTGDYVDIFGVIGDDPGTAWTAAGGYSTLDKTLVRKPEVSGGITVNPTGTGVMAFTTLAMEWNLYDRDYIDDLGTHTFAGGSEEVQTPTVQASGIIAYPANDMMSLEWTPGNGARRIVKINTVNSFTTPADGSDPSANPVYGGSGEQVIFKGSTQIIEDAPYNGCMVSGLQPDTAYWFRIYEFNGSGAQTKYLSTTAMDNPITATTTDTSQLGYYDGIYGYGTTLKSNLHTLLRTTHSTWFSYNALWTQLAYTDQDPDNPNNIIEIYTGWSVPISHQGGGTTQWNREHTWSKSHGGFGDTAPAGTDLHHLRPCDATVNSSKGNRDFDMGSTPHTDASPYPGYDSVTGCFTDTFIWEPRDEDKGDVARMMMYMAVRYEGTDTSYDLELVDYINSSPNHQPYYGKLSTLLQWHIQDPPDSRERQRNERIF